MSPIETMRERREAKKVELDALLALPATENRTSLSDDESTKFDSLVEEIRKADEQIDKLAALEVRSAAADAVRVAAGTVGEQRSPATVKDAPVYAKGNPNASYFRDLFLARNEADHDASDRLRRNDRMRVDEVEKRALSVTAGAGGDFAPPLWLISDFAALARPGRKFVDSVGPKPLPKGVQSVNIPRVATGTTTAVQATNNTALSQTDATTAFVTSGITTIGGKQVVPLQLLNQSGIPFDEVVMMDLAADYARQFDVQFINGSAAAGQLNGVYTYFAASGTANVTYTQATPAVGGAGGLYSKIFNAASNVETSRYMAPDTIWMHPRRWNWILSSSDTQNRPLVVPQGLSSFNNVGTDGGNVPQGYVGTLGGLDVITDANIPINTGVGTNQDPMFVGYKEDLRVWESDIDMQAFTATYADSAGVLFRALAFSAAIPNRYTTSVSIINGTGLVTPTF